MDDYQYFENEGAFYRSKVQAGGFVGWIDDVWTPEGWETYKGDSAYRYSTVSRIAAAAVPPFPKPKAAPVQPVKPESARELPNLIDLTSEAQGKAFQILAAPGKLKEPKPR